jgi:hypothetical protein
MGAKAAVALLISGCLGIGPANAADKFPVVGYPLPWMESLSGRYVAGFETRHLPGKDSGAYRLVVRKIYDDHDLAKYDFYRSADAQWSKFADSLFVTDYSGSTAADCLVLADAGRDRTFQGLLNLLPSKGLPGWDPRDMTSLHAYMVCKEWIDATHLRAEFDGYDSMGHEFDHHLIYDTAARRLREE